jgi:hypothetical protein
MALRTLHSDRSAPDQVLAVYACPECGFERRLPIPTRERPSLGDQLTRGAA